MRHGIVAAAAARWQEGLVVARLCCGSASGVSTTTSQAYWSSDQPSPLTHRSWTTDTPRLRQARNPCFRLWLRLQGVQRTGWCRRPCPTGSRDLPRVGFTRCPCSSEALCRTLLRYPTDTAQADGAGACRRRHCRRRRRAGVQGRSLLLSQRRARHPPLQAGHQAAMARPTMLGVFCALAALVAVGGRAEPPRCRYLKCIPCWLQSQVRPD